MGGIDSLIQQLEQNGKVLFWQGRASQSSIDKLESLLDSRLPASFRDFLAEYGGGGFDDADALICGIEDDDPTLEHRGTVYGDTLLCREAHALPENLVVVYLSDDHVVWCLDVSQFDGDECSVVAFDVFSRSVETLAPTFFDFLAEYLTSRISR
jgi:antitoxin YobK